jgi:ActR/RegA family two-component response regulator
LADQESFRRFIIVLSGFTLIAVAWTAAGVVLMMQKPANPLPKIF